MPGGGTEKDEFSSELEEEFGIEFKDPERKTRLTVAITACKDQQLADLIGRCLVPHLSHNVDLAEKILLETVATRLSQR